MFDNKNIKNIKDTIDDFNEHMQLVSDEMVNMRKDLSLFVKELNYVKVYLNVIIKLLCKQDILDKEQLDSSVKNLMSDNVKAISKSMKQYELNMKTEDEIMKNLIEKLTSSIDDMIDEDGKPIAEA